MKHKIEYVQGDKFCYKYDAIRGMCEAYFNRTHREDCGDRKRKPKG